MKVYKNALMCIEIHKCVKRSANAYTEIYKWEHIDLGMRTWMNKCV